MGTVGVAGEAEGKKEKRRKSTRVDLIDNLGKQDLQNPQLIMMMLKAVVLAALAACMSPCIVSPLSYPLLLNSSLPPSATLGWMDDGCMDTFTPAGDVGDAEGCVP